MIMWVWNKYWSAALTKWRWIYTSVEKILTWQHNFVLCFFYYFKIFTNFFKLMKVFQQVESFQVSTSFISSWSVIEVCVVLFLFIRSYHPVTIGNEHMNTLAALGPFDPWSLTVYSEFEMFHTAGSSLNTWANSSKSLQEVPNTDQIH